MPSYFESGFTFQFAPGQWAVRKYDIHNYYKGLSAVGLSGVDFLGIWKRRRLVLIEVKNYAGPYGSIPGLSELTDTAVRKYRDTFTGLETIRKMYERKWLYRMSEPILRQLPAARHDWPFWTQVWRLARQPSNCVAVLWLEAGDETARLASRLKPAVEQEMKAYCHRVILPNGSIHPFGDSLRIEEGLKGERADKF